VTTNAPALHRPSSLLSWRCLFGRNVVLPNEAVCTRLVAHLEELMAGSASWTDRRREEFVGSLKTKPGLGRYLLRTGGGLLRVDAAAIKRESHQDGKWLLRACDSTLTPQDLAAA